MTAAVLCLQKGENAAYLVAARYPRFGTFFIIARKAKQPFAVVWNIKDIAAEHYPLRDEIGYWAYIGFPYNDGPLAVIDTIKLPNSETDVPRFLINAHAARFAGGTGPSQLSIWEWNGAEANPLLIKTYQTSTATPGTLVFDVEFIRVPTKEEFKTFFSCGMCEEPIGEWTIHVKPEGILDLGTRHIVQELELIDELYYLIQRRQPTESIAALSVTDKLVKVIPDIRSLSDDEKKYSALGMLGDWIVQQTSGGSRICLETDEVQRFIFTIVWRNKKGLVIDAFPSEKSCNNAFLRY